MNKPLGKILRFAAFSASTLVGTGVDTLVLWLCSHFWLNGTYVGENFISPVISFECAVIANFLVAYFGVWRDRVPERTKRNIIRRFLQYNASCIAGFMVKMFFLILVKYLSEWDVVWCNLVALTFSGCFNFAMNEWVVFRPKTKK